MWPFLWRFVAGRERSTTRPAWIARRNRLVSARQGTICARFLATARNRLSRPRSLLALAIARSPGDAARGGGQSRRTLGREQRVKRRERRASHYAHCELSSSLPLQGMSGRGSASPAMRGCPARGLYDLNGGFIQWTQIRWMRPYPSITDPTTLSFTPKHYIHEQKLFCEGPPC